MLLLFGIAIQVYNWYPYSPAPQAQDPWPDFNQPFSPMAHSSYFRPPLQPQHQSPSYFPSPVASVPFPMATHPLAPPPRPVVSLQRSVAQQEPSRASSHGRKSADWYAASEVTFEGRLKQDLDIAEIQVELGRKNYKRKFHNLICWEEKRHIEILGNK